VVTRGAEARIVEGYQQDVGAPRRLTQLREVQLGIRALRLISPRNDPGSIARISCTKPDCHKIVETTSRKVCHEEYWCGSYLIAPP
jgi:hypothetical protein